MNFYSSPIGIPALQLQIYEPVTHIAFYIIVAVVLEAIAVYAWLCKTPFTRAVAFVLALRSIWLWALILVTSSSDVTDKIFWVAVQQFCAIGQIPTDFLILMYAARQNSQIVNKGAQALMLLAAVFGLLLATSMWHGWHWNGIFWDGSTFGVVRGPALIIALLLYFLLSLVYLVYWFNLARKTPGLRRWQIMVLPADLLFPAFGRIQWIFDQHAGAIPALPLGFLLSGLAWVWIFYALKFFNLMPLAQVQVIRKMNDSLIVIDDDGYIVELNPAAQERFGKEMPPDLVGGKFSAAFAAWPALVEMAASREAKQEEIRLGSGCISGYYVVMIEPLTGLGGRSLGKAMVLRDISEQKKVQLQNLEQQTALSILAERNRLARELHDAQGQFPGSVKTLTQAIRLLLKNKRIEDADRQLERLIHNADIAFTDVRESIASLKITAEDWNFFQHLQTWLSQFEKNSTIVTIYTGPKAKPPKWIAPKAEVQLLRIVQEVLTNARKHSGANRVEVAFSVGDDRLTVALADNGSGFDAKNSRENSASFGLGIIKERAEEIGADCKIRSEPNQGTVVTVKIPLLLKTQEKSAI